MQSFMIFLGSSLVYLARKAWETTAKGNKAKVDKVGVLIHIELKSFLYFETC